MSSSIGNSTHSGADTHAASATSIANHPPSEHAPSAAHTGVPIRARGQRRTDRASAGVPTIEAAATTT